MRSRPSTGWRLAPALAACCSAACASIGPAPAHDQRVELLVARRNPESGLDSTDDDQKLFGATYVVELDDGVAGELGLIVGRFDRPHGGESDYGEAHVGARFALFELGRSARPYLGVGLLWNGRGSVGDTYEPSKYESDDDGSFFVWLLANSGPYAVLGVDVRLGDLIVGCGLRASCAEGVDLSARHPDDFALDLFATIGWSF